MPSVIAYITCLISISRQGVFITIFSGHVILHTRRQYRIVLCHIDNISDIARWFAVRYTRQHDSDIHRRNINKESITSVCYTRKWHSFVVKLIAATINKTELDTTFCEIGVFYFQLFDRLSVGGGVRPILTYISPFHCAEIRELCVSCPVAVYIYHIERSRNSAAACNTRSLIV